MKMRFFLLSAMMFASLLAWADPVIRVDADSVQFGQVDVGYPVTRTIAVTGTGLESSINLSIESRYADEFSVTPKTITPEEAVVGVTINVKYSPKSKWSDHANLVMTSEGVDDVVIPITTDPQRKPTISGYNNHRSYSTSVGGMATSVEVAYFADAEVPTDPNNPVLSSAMNDNFDLIELDGIEVSDNAYAVSIEGDDCFSAAIVRSSSIANTCTVRISYKPTTCGTHHAVLNVTCNRAGVPMITVNLDGEAPPNADVDGDGDININDLSRLIDILLGM